MTPVLLSLSALLAASAWTAPAAGAAPRADRPAAVPSGWEKVDAAGLAHLTQETAARKAPLAAADDVSAQAEEPELLAVQSLRNGKFVATEKTYPDPHTGALRARSAAYNGSWEGFAFEWDGTTGTYALKSLANDRYVAVEKNFAGDARNELRARSTGVGGWERFVLYHNEDLNRWALQSTLNGLFVSMENSYTGSLQYVLRARSESISGWEEFDLYGLGA
ncbi:hypothetical protein ABTY20_13605 [Streptomyces sp. NPDC126497]|uniref:fascin domain-containing protein n=1 Tax=Streptomyces sp. NPDC126497 TaxID=3155313 RepID=UPI00333455D1